MSPFIYPFIPFCFLSFICYIHVSFPFLLSHVLLVSHSISSSVSFLVFIPDFLSSYVSCHPFLPFHFLLPLLLFTSPDFFFPFFSFSPTVSPLLFLLIVISLIYVHLIPLFFPFLISTLYPLVFTCVYSSSWSLLSPFASSPMVFLFINRFRSILFTLLSSWFISSCVLSFPFFPCFLLRFVFSSVCPPYLFFPHLIFVLSSISMLCFLSLCKPCLFCFLSSSSFNVHTPTFSHFLMLIFSLLSSFLQLVPFLSSRILSSTLLSSPSYPLTHVFSLILFPLISSC